jgi:DNA-binding transcriptional ArsR family regulator
MTDHNDDVDVPGIEPAVPDYPLAETLELTEAAQYAAAFEETRAQIISLLSERAATTSELAQVLDKPKGTVGYHLKVLEEAGLVHVVRTKKVRAIEAKYYGRTARIFLYHRAHQASSAEQQVMSTAATEVATVPEDTQLPFTANIRYVRIPEDRAEEWVHRLNDLLVEFADQPRGGEVTYAMAIALYPTTRRPLPADAQDDQP